MTNTICTCGHSIDTHWKIFKECFEPKCRCTYFTPQSLNGYVSYNGKKILKEIKGEK